MSRRNDYKVPSEYLSKEVFEAVSNYVITKPELQDLVITVNTLGYKIVGCPVCIVNKKYNRNELLFNLCLVFDSDTRTAKYEPVVQKLSTYLTQLELESNFLSDETKKTKFPEFLQNILTKLNHSGSCSIFVNESCTIHLKVSPCIDDPRPVKDHDVPIFIDRPKLINTQWDLTTQQVLQYIDGYNHVAKIAAEADIEINLVKACLQNLLHFNVITIISIFQYSNSYTTTDLVRQLYDDHALQEECLKFVASKGHVKPTFRDVFMLYSNLTPGLTIKDLCVRFNPHSLKIDEKKLIQFGLKNKIIRRLHGYPIKLANDAKPSPKLQAILKYLNGTYSQDEISCKSGLNYKDIEETIESDPSVFMCWK